MFANVLKSFIIAESFICIGAVCYVKHAKMKPAHDMY